MKKWTKEAAESTVSKNIGEGKKIYMDGSFSLRQCSAADYLVNYCGYISGVKATPKT